MSVKGLVGKVTVELGSRSYPILFDGLSSIGEHLTRIIGGDLKVIVISNSVVGPIYSKFVIESLEAAKHSTAYLEIEDGENAKTLESYTKLQHELLALPEPITRGTILVAVGGGATTDLVGFVAATCLRGLDFVTVPTTLLAMVDASVGGKTGVNTPSGKNLVGAFHQPKAVLIDMKTLETLPIGEVRSGLGEVLKHAVIDSDDSYLKLLEASNIFDNEKVTIDYEIVKRSCEVKAQVVAEDERETAGRREVLNLGHTIGHAIETFSLHKDGESENNIKHGEAVAMGTLAELQLCGCDSNLIERVVNVMKQFGLRRGISVNNEEVEKMLEYCGRDKKRVKKWINVVSVKKIGDVSLRKFLVEELRPAFERLNANKDL